MSTKQIIIAALLLLGLLRARGENVKTLSLSEAREIAIKNHPRITAAELIALASRQAVRQAQSAYYPMVVANATAAGAAASNTRIAAGALNNPLIFSRNAEGINVTQIITDFGRTVNLSASSKLHAKAEAQNAQATRAEILLALDAAYFEALQAQSVLEVAKQTVATRQLTFDQVNELAKNNLKSGLDVSFANVNLGEGKLLLADAHNELQSAFERLTNLLGERERRSYRLLEEPTNNTPIPDDMQLVQAALSNRPDLLQLRFEHDASLRFARAEKDLHYPTLSAAGAAGVSPVHDPLMRDNYAAVGMNLSLPIFEGFLFSAREEEAQLKARALGEDLRNAEDNVIRDVRVAALDLSYAAERVTLTTQLLESANQAFELAQARYKVGSSSIVELSQAQLNKTQAQIAQSKAKYEYQIRQAVLNFQTGQLR
jgi:outer membrane protein